MDEVECQEGVKGVFHNHIYAYDELEMCYVEDLVGAREHWDMSTAYRQLSSWADNPVFPITYVDTFGRAWVFIYSPRT